MSKEFCTFFNHGLFLSDKRTLEGKLTVMPCCLFKTAETLENNGLAEIQSRWQTIDRFVPDCERCEISEKATGKSYRKTSEMFKPDDDHSLTNIEIDYSNACNAACAICRPQNSIKIAKLYQAEGKIFNAKTLPRNRQQEFFDVLNDLDLGKLQQLKIRGGEPLYIDFHEKVMKMIPNPENVSIFYSTNGSIFPTEETW